MIVVPDLVAGPLWLIGCGNMAGAMLRRWLETGIDPAAVTVVRRSGAPVAPGVAVLTALPKDGAVPSTVMLGVKPQALDTIAPGLAPLLAPESVLVSILAGVETASLRRRFPVSHIVRAMPNLPVATGRGVVALCGEAIDVDLRARVTALMAPLGLVEWIEEAMFDAVTALAGSGPAFVYRFIAALAAAGADAGLDPARAERLALATVAGAGMLAADTDEAPDALAERVASPGGSTRKGLDVLDADGAFRRLVGATLAAAIRHNRDMAAAARGTADRG